MTGGVSRFWSKWILGNFDRGGGYAFDLVFVVLYNIVMYSFVWFSFVVLYSIVMYSFVQF